MSYGHSIADFERLKGVRMYLAFACAQIFTIQANLLVKTAMVKNFSTFRNPL